MNMSSAEAHMSSIKEMVQSILGQFHDDGTPFSKLVVGVQNLRKFAAQDHLINKNDLKGLVNTNDLNGLTALNTGLHNKQMAKLDSVEVKLSEILCLTARNTELNNKQMATLDSVQDKLSLILNALAPSTPF